MRLFNKVKFFAHLIVVDFEELVFQQLVKILDSAVRLGHQHRNHQLDEALWHLLLLIKLFRVRMIFEKVCIPWLHVQEIIVNITLYSFAERWCTERKDEKENTEREDVSRSSLAAEQGCVMYFWCHVERCT